MKFSRRTDLLARVVLVLLSPLAVILSLEFVATAFDPQAGFFLGPNGANCLHRFNDLPGGGDDENRLAQNRVLMPLLLVDDFFTANFRFYRWARYGMAVRDKRSGEDAKRVAPDKFKHDLEEIVGLARGAGAKVMLLNFAELRRQLPYKTALLDVSAELNVPLLLYEGPKFDIVHPTAEGYRAFVEVLLTRLEQEGWLVKSRLAKGSQT